MDDPVAVVLAAGQGKRMKSDLPKVVHQVCGRPMVEYVLDASRDAGVQRIIVVIGHLGEMVKDALRQHADVEFAIQSERKGTGHAVMMCREQLAGHNGPVLVLSGDTPLVRPQSLCHVLEEQRRNNAACVIGSAMTNANQGLGRIVRDSAGNFLKIVEEKDATPAEKAIREVNTGCYAFDGPGLFRALDKIRPDNEQGEYYLTDCASVLLSEGKRVLASPTFDIVEAMGVNTLDQLADVERALLSRR